VRYLAYGGGTNSAAILCGWVERGLVEREPIDVIYMANTGGEKPHTYAHLVTMSEWAQAHGLPRIELITRIRGRKQTLEEMCLRLGVLPSIAYGRKSCSQRFKTEVQDIHLNRHPLAREAWARGEHIEKLIGYDFHETRRWMKDHIDDGKYSMRYPLVQWEWGREECVAAIKRHGLPLPGKSACFFCPSSTKPEIDELKRTYPVLFQRAIALEDNAQPKLNARRAAGKGAPKGLGRRFSWRDYAVTDEEPIIEHCTEVCHDG
jgi:hypothetical protein